MEVLKPEFLWLLPLFILFLGSYFYIKGKKLLDFILFTVLGILISLSLSEPVLKKGYKTVLKKETEIVIVLDHSLSMAVKDIKPSRFEKAKEKLIKLTSLLKGEKVGLVLFSDNPEVVFYPLNQVNRIRRYLENTNIPLKGSTNLMGALSVSNSLFSTKERIIILVSDGGDEGYQKLLSLLKKTKVRVIFYAVATENGGTVPFYKAVSKLNTNLKKISDITGGLYIHYTEDDTDIKRISSFIKGISKKTEKVILKIPDYLYLSPFISVFSLALIAFVFFSKRFLLTFVAFLFFSGISEAGEILGYVFYTVGKYQKAGEEFIKEKKPESQFNGAVSFIKARMYNKALKILKKIKTENPELKVAVRYNIAYILALKKEYKKSYNLLKLLYQIKPYDRRIKKLYFYVSMILSIEEEKKPKTTIVKVKEEKKQKKSKSKSELGTKNPW